MTTVPRYNFRLESWHSCHLLFLLFNSFLHDFSIAFHYPVANTTSVVLIRDSSISPTSLCVCYAHRTAKAKHCKTTVNSYSLLSPIK